MSAIPIPRTVVITGASSGIGKALALHYARQAATLGLLGRNELRLSQTADDCQRLGGTVHVGNVDVRARSDMEQWLQKFDAGSPIDLLVANAGVMAGRGLDLSIESASDSFSLMETNILGVLNTVQPIIPRMMARGCGQIGIISSLAAFVPLPDAPSYSASKAAILNYGLALRDALRRSGIGVSVICPGYVLTPMMAQETGRKPFAIAPQQAADLIARGLQRNRPIVTFPFWFALITRLSGLLPVSLQRWTIPAFAVSPRSENGA